MATYADMAEKLAKKRAKYEKKLESKDPIAKNTAKRMIARIDGMMDQLFQEQEASKASDVNSKQEKAEEPPFEQNDSPKNKFSDLGSGELKNGKPSFPTGGVPPNPFEKYPPNPFKKYEHTLRYPDVTNNEELWDLASRKSAKTMTNDPKSRQAAWKNLQNFYSTNSAAIKEAKKNGKLPGNIPITLEGWDSLGTEETKQLQKTLKDSDRDLGTYGNNGDGVDGIVGEVTMHQGTDFIKNNVPTLGAPSTKGVNPTDDLDPTSKDDVDLDVGDTPDIEKYTPKKWHEKADWDKISQLGSIGADFLNKRAAINKMETPEEPILQDPLDLNKGLDTRKSVNAASRMRRLQHLNAGNNFSDKQTAQAVKSKADSDFTRQMVGINQKENNYANQMENQERQVNNQIDASNVRRMNSFNKATTDFNNNQTSAKANSVSDALRKVQMFMRDKKLQKLDETKFDMLMKGFDNSVAAKVRAVMEQMEKK